MFSHYLFLLCYLLIKLRMQIFYDRQLKRQCHKIIDPIFCLNNHYTIPMGWNSFVNFFIFKVSKFKTHFFEESMTMRIGILALGNNLLYYKMFKWLPLCLFTSTLFCLTFTIGVRKVNIMPTPCLCSSQWQVCKICVIFQVQV